jgi:glycosyltransferase involved in cell wall biosynthesis
LWREGLDFEVRFIGGGGVSRQFPSQVARLARRGRPVSIATAVTDAELESAYADARFSVFASVHEGYGLPIAESLAHGTPVITSDYGSTREIAATGGTLVVDPRDDDAIVDAMRRLLTDDSLVRKIREEITQRPNRTWADYAAELWRVLVADGEGSA